MEVSGQLLAPAALPPRKSLPAPMGGPKNRSERYGKEEKPSPCRESNPGRPVRNP
jgi:hypothetical protein